MLRRAPVFPRMINAEDMFRAHWEGLSNSFAIESDLYETPESVVAELVLPGIKPEDLNITVTGDTLTISGESVRNEEEAEHREYYHKEVRYGRFAQSFTLPAAVRADAAEAHFANGILKVVLPKAEEAKPKNIQVKVSGE